MALAPEALLGAAWPLCLSVGVSTLQFGGMLRRLWRELPRKPFAGALSFAAAGDLRKGMQCTWPQG